MMEDTFNIKYTNVDALQAENKRLREALEGIANGDRYNLIQLMSNPPLNAEAFILIKKAKQALTGDE